MFNLYVDHEDMSPQGIKGNDVPINHLLFYYFFYDYSVHYPLFFHRLSCNECSVIYFQQGKDNYHLAEVRISSEKIRAFKLFIER